MRTTTIHYQVSANDEGDLFTAKVSVMSYGAFPTGSRPLPYTSDDREKAATGLKSYVRALLRNSRVRFVES